MLSLLSLRNERLICLCSTHMGHAVTPLALLRHRLEAKSARVAIIGLGYAGLPLAVAFAEAGLAVTGIDLDQDRVTAITTGRSYAGDVSSARLAACVRSGKLEATTEYDELAACDAAVICVPTPLNKTGDPDIASIVAAATAMVPHLHPGMVVVLESTTYPGTTAEVVRPILEDPDRGLVVGESIFLAFSPERIDPGRQDWTVESTPRVIGGITPACLKAATALYAHAIRSLVPVSSAEAAEMTKLLENTFRAINIGLANEILLMCDKLGLDAREVIDAASTKPFGFMRFTPGPGLGGHCIPVDPLYLSWRLKHLNYRARFIELATEINRSMPAYWVQKVQDALNEARKPLKGSAILVLGVTYKRDTADTRESPALDIIQLLLEKGAAVSYHDPYVPVLNESELALTRVPDLDAALAASDCVVIATDHTWYDWPALAKAASLTVDTRHVAH